MAKNKNTVLDSDLGKEFADIKFSEKNPLFGDDEESKEGNDKLKEDASQEEIPAKKKFVASKPRKKPNKNDSISLKDCIDHTKELEANDFFKDNVLTSINIPRKTMQLTSSLARGLGNLAHYQLVTGILMKVLSDNREEVEQIIKEMAEKNTESLF